MDLGRTPHLPPQCRRSGCLDLHFPHVGFRTYSQTERLCRADGRRPNLPDRLPPDWYRRKIAQVQQEMAKRNLDALVLLRAVNVIYTTGYFSSFDRASAGCPHPQIRRPRLFIPGLESDQVKLWWVKDLRVVLRLSRAGEPRALDLRAALPAADSPSPASV